MVEQRRKSWLPDHLKKTAFGQLILLRQRARRSFLCMLIETQPRSISISSGFLEKFRSMNATLRLRQGKSVPDAACKVLVFGLFKRGGKLHIPIIMNAKRNSLIPIIQVQLNWTVLFILIAF